MRHKSLSPDDRATFDQFYVPWWRAALVHLLGWSKEQVDRWVEDQECDARQFALYFHESPEDYFAIELVPTEVPTVTYLRLRQGIIDSLRTPTRDLILSGVEATKAEWRVAGKAIRKIFVQEGIEPPPLKDP